MFFTLYLKDLSTGLFSMLRRNLPKYSCLNKQFVSGCCLFNGGTGNTQPNSYNRAANTLPYRAGDRSVQVGTGAYRGFISRGAGEFFSLRLSTETYLRRSPRQSKHICVFVTYMYTVHCTCMYV